jgi:hypothetical protein
VEGIKLGLGGKKMGTEKAGRILFTDTRKELVHRFIRFALKNESTGLDSSHDTISNSLAHCLTHVSTLPVMTEASDVLLQRH